MKQHIESLIFSAQGPISYNEIKASLEDSFDSKMKKQEIEKNLGELVEKYQSEDFSFEIIEIANGYQFFTKGAFHQTIGSHLKQTAKKRLSRAALETLSIIAYKQPVSKGELERIRGVSCDYATQKLLEKELVTIIGRSESPGRPLLYGTSEKFMDYFGIKDINELPKPKDFALPENQVGEAAPIEELSPEEEQEAAKAMDEMASEVASAISGEEIEPMSLEIEDAVAVIEDTAADIDITETEAAEGEQTDEDVLPAILGDPDEEGVDEDEGEYDEGEDGREDEGPIYVPIRAEGDSFENLRVVTTEPAEKNIEEVRAKEEE